MARSDEDDDGHPRKRARRDDEGDDRPRKRSLPADGDDDEPYRPTGEDRAKNRQTDEDDDSSSQRDSDDAPRKKKKRQQKRTKRKKGIGVLVAVCQSALNMLAPSAQLNVALGAFVVALVLGGIAVFEGSFSFKSSAQPEEISLKNLIVRGRNGNPHVVVTDFVLCQKFVKWFPLNHPDSWTGVYVPIVPVDEAIRGPKGEVMTPGNIKVVFTSERVGNEQDLEAKFDKPSVQGLINPLKSLSGETRRLLQQNYPETDFDQCIIIQADGTPWKRRWVYLIGALTVVPLLVGVVFLVAYLNNPLR